MKRGKEWERERLRLWLLWQEIERQERAVGKRWTDKKMMGTVKRFIQSPFSTSQQVATLKERERDLIMSHTHKSQQQQAPYYFQKHVHK